MKKPFYYYWLCDLHLHKWGGWFYVDIKAESRPPGTKWFFCAKKRMCVKCGTYRLKTTKYPTAEEAEKRIPLSNTFKGYVDPSFWKR